MLHKNVRLLATLVGTALVGIVFLVAALRVA